MYPVSPVSMRCIRVAPPFDNQRPPGPQPEGSGYVGRDSALYSDVGASELLSVALALDPGLRPVAVLALLLLEAGDSQASSVRATAAAWETLRASAVACASGHDG